MGHDFLPSHGRQDWNRHRGSNARDRQDSLHRRAALLVLGAALLFLPRAGAATLTTVIVDDETANTSSNGAWVSITKGRTYGPDARVAQDQGWYSFSPPLLPGQYRVYLWWTSARTRSASVPVAVNTPTREVSLTVNQRQSGGRWNLLGTFDLDATAAVSLEVPLTGTVCADAVKFEPVAPAPPPPEPDLPPLAPTGLAATVGSSAVLLDWNNNTETDLAGYSVYRSAAGGAFALLASRLTSSGFNDTAVQSGTSYLYYVTATDAAGQESPPSSQASATVAPPPPAPSSLTLAWDAPTTRADGTALTNLAGYRLYLGLTPAGYTSYIPLGLVTQYTFDSLGPGTYYFAVTALDSYGSESPFSEGILYSVQ